MLSFINTFNTDVHKVGSRELRMEMQVVRGAILTLTTPPSSSGLGTWRPPAMPLEEFPGGGRKFQGRMERAAGSHLSKEWRAGVGALESGKLQLYWWTRVFKADRRTGTGLKRKHDAQFGQRRDMQLQDLGWGEWRAKYKVCWDFYRPCHCARIYKICAVFSLWG